jgi:tetratricopeptide (TPR) repeat protein
MSWWKNLLTGGPGQGIEKVDYYAEGEQLLRQDKLHEALTSFRIALREKPNDTDVLLQMAMVYTRIGTTEEAVRLYRRVLDIKPHASGAHYGLAYLLLGRGQRDEAVMHLRAFLARPPRTPDAERHLDHARSTLVELTGEGEIDADFPADRG